jgi:hypothetical protein
MYIKVTAMYKFWKKSKPKNPPKPCEPAAAEQPELSLEALKQSLGRMSDAEFVERAGQRITLVYIKTLIDAQRLNECIAAPLAACPDADIETCIHASHITKISALDEAQSQLMSGSVLLHDANRRTWWGVELESPVGRAIEASKTETVVYGPKDSFSEQLEQNITLIRRRLPITTLKTEKFTVGSLSKTTVILMYIEGLTNPEFISIAKNKLEGIHFDFFLDSSHVAALMEDHKNTIFPQFQQTERPDTCASALESGKVVFLVGNTPFALVAPIHFFHLFQSPEDYVHRWPVATFMRILRFCSFLVSMIMVPFYVAVTAHHYQMIPLPLFSVLLESRSKLPFSPFGEAFIMLITLEVLKEASLRMPSKSGQTLGVVGGIVIGQAAVKAGFASDVLIVLVAVSAISSFLVPNYLLTRANAVIQILFLVFAAFLGVLGIVLGLIGLAIHLNGLTSLKQPYLSPVSPFYLRDWKDTFIRAPLSWMKTRPATLHPLQKWRYNRRR